MKDLLSMKHAVMSSYTLLVMELTKIGILLLVSDSKLLGNLYMYIHKVTNYILALSNSVIVIVMVVHPASI